MICDDCKQDLSAYLDDELETERRREFDEHLGGCEACRTQLDTLRKLTSLLRDVPRAKAPPGLAPKIVDAAKKGGMPRILRIRSWIPAAAAAAAVLLAVLIGISGGDRHEAYSRPRDARSPAAAPAVETATVAEKSAGEDARAMTGPRDAFKAEKKAGRAHPKARALDEAADAPPAPVVAKEAPAAPRGRTGRKRAVATAADEMQVERTADPAAQASLNRRQEGLVGVRQDAAPADDAFADQELDASDLVAIDEDAAFGVGAAGAADVVQEEPSPDSVVDGAQGWLPVSPAEQAERAPPRDADLVSRDLRSTLYVHVTADDISKEAERVRTIALAIGGKGSRDDEFEKMKDAPVEGLDSRRADRVVVWVPSDRAGDFFAVLEGLTIPDGVGENQDAVPDRDVKAWTRIEVMVQPSPETTPTALAAAKKKDVRESEAEMIRRRMADLMGAAADAGPEAARAAPDAGTLARVEIDTTIRCHLMPLRDVESERQRVRALAVYYGGKIVYDTSPPKTAVPDAPDAMSRLRLRMPAQVAAEFVKAARLGFTPPVSARTDGRGPPSAERPAEWVAVEITIGRTAPAATETSR
jgi:hypothetical protein